MKRARVSGSDTRASTLIEPTVETVHQVLAEYQPLDGLVAARIPEDAEPLRDVVFLVRAGALFTRASVVADRGEAFEERAVALFKEFSQTFPDHEFRKWADGRVFGIEKLNVQR